MTEKTKDKLAMSVVSCLKGEALHFYLEMLTEGSQVASDGKIYSNDKSNITAKYSKEKSEIEIIQDAVLRLLPESIDMETKPNTG